MYSDCLRVGASDPRCAVANAYPALRALLPNFPLQGLRPALTSWGRPSTTGPSTSGPSSPPPSSPWRRACPVWAKVGRTVSERGRSRRRRLPGHWGQPFRCRHWARVGACTADSLWRIRVWWHAHSMPPCQVRASFDKPACVSSRIDLDGLAVDRAADAAQQLDAGCHELRFRARKEGVDRPLLLLLLLRHHDGANGAELRARHDDGGRSLRQRETRGGGSEESHGWTGGAATGSRTERFSTQVNRLLTDNETWADVTPFVERACAPAF